MIPYFLLTDMMGQSLLRKVVLNKEMTLPDEV